MVSIEEIDKVIKVLDIVRQEAKKDNQYGFNDNWKDFMKRMRILNTQSSGSRMQDYIFRKLGWTRIPSKLNNGDVKNSLGQYFEVKVTTITTSNDTANIVQIRLYQNVSAYHIFVVDAMKDYELIHFQLSKNEMKQEVNLIGSQAHGTKGSVANNQNVEYAIHFKWDKNDKNYKRWINNYKQDTNLSD